MLLTKTKNNGILSLRGDEMLLILENIFQTVSIVAMLYSAYHVVYWFKKDKFVPSFVNLLGFLFFFWWYQILEFMA
ncbi:hypothetical protein PQE70_gp133 [Bacillus phage vB_BanS_Nate]|uniref:Uncharacterized protein n=1 Tax=Bacillus phage vB_BanS_Nate TaxID=2894788 RepID=A0AAE9CED5_9CAUD|nr:hypothetical protein PQE70_gp133 [Bacillus phage vB_BanS_Nate]UGO50986.1 hypothetical protein NATE_133 [Bacillus phage vB_BanS_Nate]